MVGRVFQAILGAVFIAGVTVLGLPVIRSRSLESEYEPYSSAVGWIQNDSLYARAPRKTQEVPNDPKATQLQGNPQESTGSQDIA